MNVWEEQKAYGYWLDSIPGIGKTKIRQLYARGKSASEIYHMEQKALEEILGTKASAQIMTSKENWDINGKYAKMWEKQIKIRCSWKGVFIREAREKSTLILPLRRSMIPGRRKPIRQYGWKMNT